MILQGGGGSEHRPLEMTRLSGVKDIGISHTHVLIVLSTGQV